MAPAVPQWLIVVSNPKPVDRKRRHGAASYRNLRRCPCSHPSLQWVAPRLVPCFTEPILARGFGLSKAS